ncbi:MAG: 4-phosphopantetheinyl transferase N-terminal domain [Planctomycetota bacterium]
MIRTTALALDGFLTDRSPSAAWLALVPTTDARALADAAAALPDEVHALATSYATEARRAGFLGGRVALRAALGEAGSPEAARAVLRDDRGRPVASWPDAPPFSIAHTRRRAVALVATRSMAAIGVDIEEIDARRAEALVRKAFSGAELALLTGAAAPSADASHPIETPHPIEEPIAAWCAREACVKAHALEVGWFGTALEIRGFARTDAPAHLPGEAAWRISIAHAGTPLEAYAWREDGAILAVALRR